MFVEDKLFFASTGYAKGKKSKKLFIKFAFYDWTAALFLKGFEELLKFYSSNFFLLISKVSLEFF